MMAFLTEYIEQQRGRSVNYLRMLHEPICACHVASNTHGLGNAIERAEVFPGNCQRIERALSRKRRAFVDTDAFAAFPVAKNIAVYYRELARNKEEAAGLDTRRIKPGRRRRLR